MVLGICAEAAASANARSTVFKELYGAGWGWTRGKRRHKKKKAIG